VGRIVKGTKPGVPIEQPTKFELIVNLKTAKAMGRTIQESLRVRARRSAVPGGGTNRSRGASVFGRDRDTRRRRDEQAIT